MKRTLLVAGALVVTTLLSSAAGANTGASPGLTAFSAPKTAGAPFWQTADVEHVTSSHTEKDHCGPPCGKYQCYDKANRLWVCKETLNGDPKSCTWQTKGVCNPNYKPGEDITGKK
jgi:hypothetical protein